MMQAGTTARAFASSEAPSAKQVAEYPACEKIIDSILRIAGSSSTMKISPLEGAASAILQTILRGCPLPEIAPLDAHRGRTGPSRKSSIYPTSASTQERINL